MARQPPRSVSHDTCLASEEVVRDPSVPRPLDHAQRNRARRGGFHSGLQFQFGRVVRFWLWVWLWLNSEHLVPQVPGAARGHPAVWWRLRRWLWCAAPAADRIGVVVLPPGHPGVRRLRRRVPWRLWIRWLTTPTRGT